MANENDGILSSNFEENSTNYNNNETETSSSSTSEKLRSGTLTSKERRMMPKEAGGDYRNIRATIGDGHVVEQQPRREENPFSFRQFLNRDTSSASLGSTSNSNLPSNHTVVTSASATVLSNDPQQHHHHHSSSNNNTSTPDDFIALHRMSLSGSGGTSTIASVTSSLLTSPSSSSYQTSTGARPKVPQSTVTGNNQSTLASSSISTTSMSSLVSETSKMKRSPRFSSFDSQASLAEFAGGGVNGSSSGGGSGGGALKDSGPIDRGAADPRDQNDSMSNFFPNDYDRQFVHRSYSNYDMDLPPKNVPGSGGGGGGIQSPRRRPSPPRSSNRMSAGGVCSQSSSNNKIHQSGPGGGNIRPNSEFAAVLPDFVQDHWMDPWYYNDMNLSSPHNSPASPVDFVVDLPGMSSNNQTDKCQTLPDFLNDGPIIHSSSSRLADVAAGLPDLDSPEDNSPSLQLSRLRLENDRLRRELDESRLALAEQTRRSGELERRLEQARSNESAYNRSLAQSMGQVEENLDQSKKRAAAAQSQINKLKQQVKQLTGEVESLRRENESLREEGAVGGDRVTRRPSRNSQLSRDLMRAASNAESNLRQLLSGVENLRLMAAAIDNVDRIGYDQNNTTNPVVNEDFLSDCDVDYEDFSGPAL